MKIIFPILVTSLLALNAWAKQVTEVAVIAAMHGAHKDHPSYDYQDLYQLVGSFNADFLGVEIRAEDIKANEQYLFNNYPKEMVELAKNYKSNVFGFDWLGDSIAGEAIPANYWSELWVKKLMKKMHQDNDFLNKEPPALAQQRALLAKMIEQATPDSINNGSYGKLCRTIDSLEEAWLSGSDYSELLAFNQKRDEKIGQNIINFVRQHQGQRIVLVMGADHRTFAIEALENYFAERIRILPIRLPAD